jgi:CheY-like chemotaxis protein
VVETTPDSDTTASQKRTEEALRLQLDTALRNERLEVVASLIGGVAHELNNPLALLVGHATLLRRKAGDGPLADRADKIGQAAERCARIVRNFLGLARRQPADRKPIDLGGLVKETLEILAHGLRVDGIEVEAEIAPDLPRVPGDTDRLRQLLVYLVMNAEQALRRKDGGRRLRVCVERVSVPAGAVRVVVADNGPGVPVELREKIFEPLFSTRASGEGTGMGLPLCRGIVADHGGELRLEESEEGCRFVFDLPLAAGSAPPSVTEGPAPSPGPRAILVVDDEAELASLMCDTLELAGHHAESAANGAAALARLAVRRYDLVLSDIRMPEIDGPGLHRAVQERHPELARRFVFVTGDTLSPETATFIRGVGAPVVMKPFDLEDLVRTVNGVLAKAEETP